MLRWNRGAVQFKTVVELFGTPPNVCVVSLLHGRVSEGERETGCDLVLLGVRSECRKNRAHPPRIPDFWHHFNSEGIRKLGPGAAHDTKSTRMRGLSRGGGATT